jgi:hypothetical protein
MTAGQKYLLALAHCEWGGGSKFRAWLQVPGGSMTVMKPGDSNQNGYFNVTGLANGQLLKFQNPLETNATNLVAGNTYYYRVKGVNSEGTDWADSTKTFVSERALDANIGTVSFNTNGPVPTWSSTTGTGGTGQLVSTTYTDAQQNTVAYNVARYDFDRVNIGDGATISLNGSNPLFINVTGSATILPSLDLNGTDGIDSVLFLKGRLGGGDGGHKYNGSAAPRWGQGGGPSNLTSGNFFSGGKRFTGWIDPRPDITTGREPGAGSYGGTGARTAPNGGTGQDSVPVEKKWSRLW